MENKKVLSVKKDRVRGMSITIYDDMSMEMSPDSSYPATESHAEASVPALLGSWAGNVHTASGRVWISLKVKADIEPLEELRSSGQLEPKEETKTEKKTEHKFI